MKPDLSNALTAAQGLLGWEFIHDSANGTTAGYIVETEAYTATDAASHSYRGVTPRTAVMFGPAGYLYVYFTYGMHYCVNIVTGQSGSGEAVLLRALQPTQGLALMRQRRGKLTAYKNLTNGPAKLTQAMGINKQHGGYYVLGDNEFRLSPGINAENIVQTTRIGISRETKKLWRFYISGNAFVSHV